MFGPPKAPPKRGGGVQQRPPSAALGPKKDAQEEQEVRWPSFGDALNKGNGRAARLTKASVRMRQSNTRSCTKRIQRKHRRKRSSGRTSGEILQVRPLISKKGHTAP